jgi:ferredoxin
VSCGACADSCPTDAITEIRLLVLDGDGVGRLPLVEEQRPRLKRRRPSKDSAER